jgi:hypothetical protein
VSKSHSRTNVSHFVFIYFIDAHARTLSLTHPGSPRRRD